MATAIWRNASRLRSFNRCLYVRSLSQFRSSIPSSTTTPHSLCGPSLPSFPLVRFPPHFFFLLLKITQNNLSISHLSFLVVHRLFLLELNSNPWELMEGFYLIPPKIKRNRPHHRKPILKRPKTLEVRNGAVVVKASLFAAGYFNFYSPFWLLNLFSFWNFPFFWIKKFRILFWLDWNLQPVSWLSFLLLLATGIGIIFYYDNLKKRHIEGTLLWWVVSYVKRFCTAGKESITINN